MLETHHNDQWIDLIDGTPAYTPDGRLICSVNDMRADTNRLTVDGVPFTPAGWQVRALLDADDGTVMCVVQRAPELAPDVPDAWRATAADHEHGQLPRAGVLRASGRHDRRVQAALAEAREPHVHREPGHRRIRCAHCSMPTTAR